MINVKIRCHAAVLCAMILKPKGITMLPFILCLQLQEWKNILFLKVADFDKVSNKKDLIALSDDIWYLS